MNCWDEISLQLLVEKGVVVPEILDSLKSSLEPRESVVEALIVAGHTTEEVVLGLLAKEFSLPLIDLAELESRQICREPFDRKFLIDKGIILFNRTSTECKADIFDPLKMDQLDDLSSSLSLDLQAFLSSKCKGR